MTWDLTRCVLNVSLLLSVCRAVSAGSAPGNCQNPLFATHWAGKSDIIHLVAQPTPQYDLQLCPKYNGRPACCDTAFETEQQDAFQHWVSRFRQTSSRLRAFQMEMESLKVSREYAELSFEEKALFDKAFSCFAAVHDSLGTCFDTLLEYLAGVLCFACDPFWFKKVYLDAEQLNVIHLHVDENSNDALWQSCQEFGGATEELTARISDSVLAKAVHVPFEDLRVFFSRVGVAEFMAHNGLYPFHGQQQRQQKEVVDVKPVEHDNAADAHPERRLGRGEDTESNFVDPVSDGRSSGFNCGVFPRKALPSSTAIAPSFSALSALLLPAWLILCG